MFVNKFMQNCCELLVNVERSFHTAAIVAAARKGTRAKREAKKKAAKKEEIKKVFIPYNKRLELANVGLVSPRLSDHNLPLPEDNVYFIRKHKWEIFSVSEAVEMHRETAHPSQFNAPNTDLIAHIELSMSADKKNKYIDEFSNIISLPYPYEIKQKRLILVICKDEEMANAYRIYPGIDLILGTECIKMVQKNELDLKLYDHIIAHVSLLPDLIGIRAQFRGKMPTVKFGTAGHDLNPLIQRFLHGIHYNVVKDKYDHDFGSIEISLGSLNMKSDEHEANLSSLIVDIENQRPEKLKSNRLITLVNLRTSLTREAFKIDHNMYLPVEEDNETVAVAE